MIHCFIDFFFTDCIYGKQSEDKTRGKYHVFDFAKIFNNYILHFYLS